MIKTLAVISALVAAGSAAAQTWPARSVQMVVPYAPGGIVDFIARTLGQRLSQQVGQPVVIDNRAGAGGMIGIEYTARSSPDGHTLVLMDPAVVINPVLQEKALYEMKDLATVAVIGSSPLVLTVNPKLPVTDVAQLVRFAKANPGKLNFATPGIGTTPHMAGELLKARAGIDMAHVPYKGSGPAMADLAAGQVQVGFSSITGALPFIKDGRLRALATSGSNRSAALPDLPTFIEAGYPGFEVDLWLGIFAPAATPATSVARINDEIRSALRDPAVMAAFAKVGVEPRSANPEESARFVRAEHDKWAQVVTGAHLRVK
ncbi:MAG TPA: tripartite tricarboxylate transporter substrate binding protein [Burkholderiales bacterium]|jgi:tripartite-type tricarboxylate transporter receptor subunit TctC|nr:tripartite tricarboxylate transporter substrate binding protein [Burkholderiales bacterium]